MFIIKQNVCFIKKQGNALVHLEALDEYPSSTYVGHNLCYVLAAFVLHRIQDFKLHIFSTLCSKNTLMKPVILTYTTASISVKHPISVYTFQHNLLKLSSL